MDIIGVGTVLEHLRFLIELADVLPLQGRDVHVQLAEIASNRVALGWEALISVTRFFILELLGFNVEFLQLQFVELDIVQHRSFALLQGIRVRFIGLLCDQHQELCDLLTAFL